ASQLDGVDCDEECPRITSDGQLIRIAVADTEGPKIVDKSLPWYAVWPVDKLIEREQNAPRSQRRGPRPDSLDEIWSDSTCKRDEQGAFVGAPFDDDADVGMFLVKLLDVAGKDVTVDRPRRPRPNAELHRFGLRANTARNAYEEKRHQKCDPFKWRSRSPQRPLFAKAHLQHVFSSPSDKISGETLRASQAVFSVG